MSCYSANEINAVGLAINTRPRERDCCRMANTRRSTQRAPTVDPTSWCCDDHWNARSWVLGDVGDPELVRQISRELSINQILCRGQSWDTVMFAPSGDALNIGRSHKKRHGTVTHIDPQPLSQFRMHPPCPVNATSISVHLANDISEPRVAHTARRRDSPTLRIKTAFGHVKYSTAPLN